MEKLAMCRICLVQNVRMYLVVNRNFHELYEKLTDIPFVTEDRRPILVCFFCCAKLKQCYRFLRKCLEAEELFAQMINEDYEPKPLINHDHLEYFGGFIKSPTENISIVDGVQTESIAFKEELPAVCEGLDDIIEPKEEHSDELKPENLDNICLNVPKSDSERCGSTPHLSESDLEDDLPLMEYATEVKEDQEVSKKKRKAGETKKFLTEVEEEQEVPKKKRRTDNKERETNKHRPTGPAEAMASTPGLSRSADIGAEAVMAAASSPFNLGSSEIDISDEEFDRSIVRLTDSADSDDDDDLNIDNDACLFPTVHLRNSTTESACDNDMTELVLQREDDQALRGIVSDDSFTFNWSKDRRTFLGRREKFTSASGPTFDVTDQTQPIDIFDKMFDTDFIDRLCTETNRNAEQKVALMREQNKLSPNSRYNRWCPTDRDEMISFLAILVLQSLYPLPEEEAYFKFNGFGTMMYFAKIMSYNRFLLLKTCFSFVDGQTLLDTTRLCKIRPVIDYFNNKFSTLYMPSQEVAIDEPLLKRYGSMTFAQKISTNAAQLKVRTYELCESSTGYLWKFFIDAGTDTPTTSTDSTFRRKNQPHEQTDHEPVEDEAIDRLNHGRTIVALTGDSGHCPTSATAKIVYDLMEPLLHRGHTLIMGNFYNCPLLLRCLKQKKTDCYGTLRLKRKFLPKSVKNLTKTNLKRGEVVVTYCSDLSVLVWRDAGIVSMISTYHNLQMETRNQYRVTSKPSIVLDYNKIMGGVDRKNQFLSAHQMERLSNRGCYKNLFGRLYNTAIFNSFVIYSSFHRKITDRQFRVVVAEDLLKRHRQIDLTTESRAFNVRITTNGPVTATLVRYNTKHKNQARPTVDHNHFPIRTGSKNTCCKICPKKTRTVWKCEECNVNLCINGCFRAYHKSSKHPATSNTLTSTVLTAQTDGIPD